jgi:dTDP-4-dehydrorhamnose reductase
MQADSGGILITGATGQVGEALTRTLSPFARLICPTHEEMDLANPAAIRQLMREVRPRWIVNAAAYTAVDKAESEPSVAFTLNATAPSVLAEEAAAIGAPLIHFSTDYVFDGTKSAPYVESDLTGPLNTYGCTKLAGEAAISGSTDAYFIFRTSWVYGVTGHNFLRSILRLARQRETLSIVNDQHGGPTWSFELARMTAHMIYRAASRSAPQRHLPRKRLRRDHVVRLRFRRGCSSPRARAQHPPRHHSSYPDDAVPHTRKAAAQLAARLFQAPAGLRLDHARLAPVPRTGLRRIRP